MPSVDNKPRRSDHLHKHVIVGTYKHLNDPEPTPYCLKCSEWVDPDNHDPDGLGSFYVGH